MWGLRRDLGDVLTEKGAASASEFRSTNSGRVFDREEKGSKDLFRNSKERHGGFGSLFSKSSSKGDSTLCELRTSRPSLSLSLSLVAGQSRFEAELARASRLLRAAARFFFFKSLFLKSLFSIYEHVESFIL